MTISELKEQLLQRDAQIGEQAAQIEGMSRVLLKLTLAS